jgi:hypothetical protein
MTRTYKHTGIRDIEWDPRYPRQNYNKVFKTPLSWCKRSKLSLRIFRKIEIECEIETQIKEYL